MYYVIKQHHDSKMQHFIGFVVDRYIASKNNEHVIFEFKKDGKNERKWVKKEDIILLTTNKTFFLEILNQFKTTQTLQQELVNQAKEQLELSMEEFSVTMTKEIDDFKEIKHSSDVPCLLKDF